MYGMGNGEKVKSALKYMVPKSSNNLLKSQFISQCIIDYYMAVELRQNLSIAC